MVETDYTGCCKSNYNVLCNNDHDSPYSKAKQLYITIYFTSTRFDIRSFWQKKNNLKIYSLFLTSEKESRCTRIVVPGSLSIPVKYNTILVRVVYTCPHFVIWFARIPEGCCYILLGGHEHPVGFSEYVRHSYPVLKMVVRIWNSKWFSMRSCRIDVYRFRGLWLDKSTFIRAFIQFVSASAPFTHAMNSWKEAYNAIIYNKRNIHVTIEQNNWGVMVMMVNATFNNISDISWRSVLLVEETRIHGENHRPVASHWETLSHNVVSSRSRLTRILTLHWISRDCINMLVSIYRINWGRHRS